MMLKFWIDATEAVCFAALWDNFTPCLKKTPKTHYHVYLFLTILTIKS